VLEPRGRPFRRTQTSTTLSPHSHRVHACLPEMTGRDRARRGCALVHLSTQSQRRVRKHDVTEHFLTKDKTAQYRSVHKLGLVDFIVP